MKIILDFNKLMLMDINFYEYFIIKTFIKIMIKNDMIECKNIDELIKEIV